MTRTFQGNKRDVPPGMEPMEWAQAVWDCMDTTGLTEREARGIVLTQAEREARQTESAASRAVNGPPVDKMVRTNGALNKRRSDR